MRALDQVADSPLSSRGAPLPSRQPTQRYSLLASTTLSCPPDDTHGLASSLGSSGTYMSHEFH